MNMASCNATPALTSLSPAVTKSNCQELHANRPNRVARSGLRTSFGYLFAPGSLVVRVLSVMGIFRQSTVTCMAQPGNPEYQRASRRAPLHRWGTRTEPI
jgi:hypothetical protein